MAGKKVLVVDDDAKIVELVRLYLARDGYQVLTAFDGVEALRMAREAHPDLIVLDLMLPGMDGLKVCRAEVESDVPIVCSPRGPPRRTGLTVSTWAPMTMLSNPSAASLPPGSGCIVRPDES